MSAIRPSIYSKVNITSQDGRDVDFQVACASIDIYEDVLVPAISAKITVVNAGGAIADDGVSVSMYDGLKIRGGEKVEIRIEANSANNETIDFTTKPLYVRGIKNLLREGAKEFMTMSLTTGELFDNETKFVGKAFSQDARISDHVTKILQDNFDLTPTDIDVDRTSNGIGLLGNQMHPFQLITRMASQSVYGSGGEGGVGGSAGFFFYQTREGFKFKAIDNLVKQEPKATFVQTDKNFNSLTYKPTPDLPSLDFKIVSYEVISNQDLIEKLKLGAYATQRRYFDPLTSAVSTKKDSYTVAQNTNNIPTLGSNFEPQNLKLAGRGNKSFAEQPTQIVPSTIDRGTTAKGVSKVVTRDPVEYLNQAKMRYNSLFLQVMRVQVPLNSTLHAGDVVRCKFPKVQDGSNVRFEKEQISGLYMIKELCHHFDTQASYTSMLLVRDTIGKRQ